MGASNPLYTPLDDYSSSARHVPGELFFDQTTGKTYRYIKVGTALANDTLAANEVVTLKSASEWEGTNDTGTSLDTTNPIPLGIATASIPESTASATYYCWVQVGGFCTVKTNGDDDIALGDALIPGSADGACDSIAAATTNAADIMPTRIMGVAVAADSDSANTVAALLTLAG